MQPVLIPKVRRQDPTAKLTSADTTQLMSLTQQLAWPARVSLPALNSLVSDLQQKTKNGTVAELSRANFVLREAKRMTREGHCLKFRKLDLGRPVKLEDLAAVAAPDASFGGQPGGCSQHGYVNTITTKHVMKCEICCEICGKVCSSLSDLKIHVTSNHEGKWDIFCQICDKTFVTKDVLKQHIFGVVLR